MIKSKLHDLILIIKKDIFKPNNTTLLKYKIIINGIKAIDIPNNHIKIILIELLNNTSLKLLNSPTLFPFTLLNILIILLLISPFVSLSSTEGSNIPITKAQNVKNKSNANNLFFLINPNIKSPIIIYKTNNQVFIKTFYFFRQISYNVNRGEF